MTKLLKKNILITLFATLLLSALVALAFSLRPTDIVKADESATDEAKLLFSLDFDDEESDGKYLEGHDFCGTGDKVEIKDSKAYMYAETGRSRHFFINIPAEYFLNYSNLVISFDMECCAENSEVNVFDDSSNDAFLLRAFHANFGRNEFSYIDNALGDMHLQWFKNYRVSANSHRYVVNYTSSEIDRTCFNNANLKYISFGFYVGGANIKNDFTFTVDNFRVYGIDIPEYESQFAYKWNDSVSFPDRVQGEFKVVYGDDFSMPGIDAEAETVYAVNINYTEKTISYEYTDESAESGISSKNIYENGAWVDEKYKEIEFSDTVDLETLFFGIIDWFKSNTTKTQKYTDLTFYAEDGETELGTIHNIPIFTPVSDCLLSQVTAPEKDGEVFAYWTENIENGENVISRYSYEISSVKAVYVSAINVKFMDGENVYESSIVGKGSSFSDVVKNVTPQKTGYTFKFWSLTENGEPIELTEITEDVTLYAVYEINTYNVKFMDGENVKKLYVLNYGSIISEETLKTDLDKSGYILKGISESSDGKITEISDVTVTDNVTYYVRYSNPNSSPVVSDSEPDSFDWQKTFIIAGSAIVLISCITLLAVLIKKK